MTGVNRSTVSMLWPKTDTPLASTVSTASCEPLQSLTSTSTFTSGQRVLMALTVAAIWTEPPSGRSSRVTQVMTAKRRPSVSTVSATCCGSSGSTGRGLPCATEQNLQLRVQMSPKTMNVAVRCFQQSPRFGHFALSQTVCNFARCNNERISTCSLPPMNGARSHDGLPSSRQHGGLPCPRNQQRNWSVRDGSATDTSAMRDNCPSPFSMSQASRSAGAQSKSFS